MAHLFSFQIHQSLFSTAFQFQPTSVPTDGGSVLTLYGNQLGTITDEYSKVVVSICDQPCDNVKAKGTNVTCTVRKKCSLCQDSCRVNVSVEIRSLPSKYNLTGGSRLTYVNPEVSEFFPEYGPVSGRTQVSLTGQHLDSGSDTTVKIAGADCEIVNRHKSVILCNVVGSKQSKPGCGSVDLTIDNFHTNVSQVNYCLRPDPIIQSIAPLRSIESGGIIITIKGSHLDSATSFSLELHTPLDGQDDDEILLLKHESNCTLPNGRGELMICPSPPIPRFETLIKKTLSGPIAENGKHLSMDLHLVLDSRNVLQDDSDLPHKFVVYGDPTLFGFTPGTEDAFVDVRNPVLNIRGENFPTWIPYSNIKVTIANWTCQITSVTQKLVKCDGKKAAEFVLKEMGKLEPTQIVTTEVTTVSNSTNSYLENFTVSDGQTGQTEMETTSTVLTTVTKNSNSTNGFMSTAKTSERGRERNSNKGQSGLTKKNGFAMKSAKPEGSDVNLPQPPIMSLLDNDHEPVEITEKPMQRFSKEFTVKIEIGYLTRGLGKIQIGYDPERPPPTNAPIPNDSTNSGLWKVAVPAAAATLVLLLVAALVLCCQLIKTRRRARRMQKMAPYYMGSMSGSAPPGSAPGSKESAHPTLKQILESIMEPNRNSELDNLIINLDRLTIGNSIGSGNFGCVYEGSLRSHDGNTTQKVAIKTLQDSSSQNLDLQSFVQEAVIMKDFCHPHVLGLVGLAERAGPECGAPYVILPYMENGDLLTYVRDPAAELSLHDVIKFGADIASGMAYLSSLKLVHRDLAARNCMLDNHQRAKVADFGLCRDIYEKGYYSSDNRKKLPIRWMAVESIEQGAYSTKSDVWSFGVVLWEMSCRGVTPYPGVDGWDVINYLRRRRLAPPFFCPDELYNIMMQCWNKDPTSRPEFNTLNGSLLSLIGQSPSKAVPIPLKRGASHGDTLKASSSSEHKYVKLPEVAGPIGKRAMARQNRKSDTEEDLKQDKSIKVDLEADGQNPVTVVVTEPSKYVIKDVQITIPACFGHRDLTQSAVLEYKNLVDNYEPAPRFTNSIKLKVGRSKKKRRESSKSGEKVDMRSSKPPIMPRSSKTKLDVSDHSGHSSLALDHSDGMPRSSGGSIRGMQSFDAREVGNYFQLESKLRDSIASDSVGQRCSRSSSIKTGSVSSLLDSQSRRSSFEPGQASNASSQVSSPAVQRSLLTRQAGGSPRSSSSGRQLPYAGIPPSSVRPHVPVAMEQSFFVEDEVSSSLDTQL
ncbi:hepatocyte growth factor receptor [Plakobranchus ocellatus]|uniref:receptor protein-tyrosine kinase n=1 Tax=Plakobranchus ocellatus TaxID=259542 RepID=A0AAV3Y0K5_9GAST|nr:hepatocyte growth factor receptor [Plakobranchus ocellatus]